MANIIDRNTIGQIIQQADINDLLRYIEQAFIAYSSGKAVVPPVGTLTFETPPGDVHIKYGYIQQDEYYVIKIASGFYENPALGLSSSNGLNLVFNQKNGLLETILLDEGYLTDVRTALAGAVVAKHLAPEKVEAIGIIGTGIQARLQLQYLRDVVDCKKVLVWGRSEENALDYQKEMNEQGFDVSVASSTEELAKACNLIVTCTPSTTPLLYAGHLQENTLITAMGADTLGKQELDIKVLQRADLIVMDSTSQCQGHGEIHKAFQNNLLSDKKMLELGDWILSSKSSTPSGIIVADLTGVATQDIQISKFVLDHL
jgi:ornithine cyclodeaminase